MIQDESKVKFHYTLTVEEEVVDSSKGGDPLEYIHGRGQIIPGLEEQLSGLKQGEQRDLTVSPESGYGMHDPEALQKVPISAFQEPEGLAVGDMITGEMQGQKFQARIAEISDEEITLDLNHPLAGKTLHFSVEVLEII